jgi:hypothetical protein
MSKIALTPNASGTGTFTIAAPNSNSNRTLTLPDEAGEVLTDARLASQAEAQAGTDNTRLMTPLRVEEHMVANAIGWGQTWETVTRTHSTSYQNTTGKPIQVAFRASDNARYFQVSSDNVNWQNVLQATGSSTVGNCSVIVPDGLYYRVNGSVNFSGTWQELR